MTRVVIMLTRDDVTIPHAVQAFRNLRDTGISDIGFKDIGLPFEGRKKLVAAIKKEHMNVYFEIVRGTREDIIRSAREAVELGVDYLIGGKYLQEVASIVKANKIRYYPYVGRVFGHPCLLAGSIDEILAEAREREGRGVDGLNLLAYRYNGDSRSLIRNLKGALKVPLLVAGSVDSPEKIQFLTRLKIPAFTVGTALFEKKFLPGASLSDQVKFVLKEANQ